MNQVIDTITVLHVDDDEDYAEMVGDLLEREAPSLSVLTETSVEDGLDRLDSTEVDCVVSDYDMPGRDGLDLLEATREDHPDLPFIMYTGKGSEELASRALGAGATDYLVKESSPEQYALLAQRIRHAVEHHHLKHRYEEVFEKVPDGILIQNIDGTILDMNARYAEMFGYDPETLLEAGFEAVLPEEGAHSIERAREKLRAAVEEGPRTFEWPGITSDGERFWTEVHLTPTTLQGETRILAVVRDISERKAHERQLREHMDKVEALHEVEARIESCDRADPIFDLVVEAAESILAFDIAIVDTVEDDVLVPAAVSSDLSTERYYDETPVDAEGNLAAEAYRTGEPSVVDDLRDQDVAPADPAFRSALTIPVGDYGVFQAVAECPGEFDRKDRELAELLVAHARARLAQLDRERELRERTRELERQNDRLREFASILSHDLRNPLNVAQGRLEELRERHDDEALAEVGAALDRCQALLEDMMGLVTGDGRTLEQEPVDLAAVVETCWRNVATDRATLFVEADATVVADRGRLKQLLENLIRNAVEHGRENVTVRVAEREDGFIVEDDGPGIPEDERDEVFDSGYSLGDAGTGLGLAVVEQVASAHGWSVDLTESDAGGTRFVFEDVEFADG